MGFLDNLFGNGTEEEVSKVVSETAKKGQEFGTKAIKKGKEVASVAKVKVGAAAAEVKRKGEIQTLKYKIGNEIIKRGLPAPKGDADIAKMIKKVKELEKSEKKASTTKKSTSKAKKTSTKGKKTAKKSTSKAKK